MRRSVSSWATSASRVAATKTRSSGVSAQTRGLDEERGGAFRGGGHGGEVLGEQPVQPFQQDGDHRLLVGEVVEQAALGDPGPPGHGIQRGGTLALFDEQGFERVKDGFAGDGFSGHGSNHAPRRAASCGRFL